MTFLVSVEEDRRSKSTWCCLLLIVLGFQAHGVRAQPTSPFAEAGRFFVRQMTWEEYGGHGQNWAVVQGDEGWIYVGNGNGVLEYDGSSWRMIHVANGSSGRSLAVDSNGRVFVGGVAELGYLAADALGQTHYVSLLDHIPEEERNFVDVWRTYALPEGVYFQTRDRILRWDGQQMKTWWAPTHFYLSYAMGDTLYVGERERGLLYLDQDTLVQAPGAATFVEQTVAGLVPHGVSAYLAITRRQGIFRCRDTASPAETCGRFSPGLTDLLARLQPTHVTPLREGKIAIGTAGGAVLVDRTGRLLHTLNETSGLENNLVWFTYEDRQGGLWLGLDNGLARAEVSSPVTYFDKTTGLREAVTSVARHRGRLYVATGQSVLVLESGALGALPQWVVDPKISEPCWLLLSTDQGMLAACRRGVHNLDKQRLVWSSPTQSVLSLYRSDQDPTKLYVGLQQGLTRLVLRDGEWHDDQQVDGVHSKVQSITEDTQGRLWLGTHPGEVLRVEAPTSLSSETKVTRFGPEDGLPAAVIDVMTIGGRLIFASDSAGLFELDSQTDSVRFVPFTTLDALLPQGSQAISALAEDAQGKVWIVAKEASGLAHPQEDGGYAFAPTALRRASNLSVYSFHLETEGAAWIGGNHGLTRYDTEVPLDFSTDYPVWIRQIRSVADSILYNGQPTQPDEAPTWPHQNNALRFTFAAPRFDAPERTHYRTRLEGFDDAWSTWSDEPHKDYTNLWEGHYVFRVQARDVYGVVSREDTFAFRILPPWFRSWWAYGLYGLACVAVILTYLRSHRQELRRERQAAERERAVSARLREVDKLKDEFLANTSHELRTPLHGITGIVESLIDGATGELSVETKDNLAMVVASGRRLSHLVDDILDFSKLRHKSLELNRRPVDLQALVDVVLTLSAPLVGSKNLQLENRVGHLPPADADENRLQQILYNLLGNAIKFTEEGAIVVSGDLEEERLVIRVTDTGIGIPQEQQAQIFKAFEQADASIEREYGGTGLGLAVTRRLVELHGGSIWVESSPGEGSTFSFSLLLADGPAEGPEVTTSSRIAELASESPARSELALEPLPAPPNRPATPSSPTEATDAAIDNVRILAVDDEPINLQILRNFLSRGPFELVTAASGEEALKFIRERRFDLVLLDVMMPKVSGFEVCRVLRESYPKEELPVLFLTAKNQASDVVAGLSLGANDYLTKPVAKDELVARLRPHLDLLEVHRHLEDLVEEKLARINVLEGILPICCQCKRIRDEENRWMQMETYIDQHSEAKFSHGLCPDCGEEILNKLG